MHWLQFTVETANGEGNERSDGNLRFGKSATLHTGAKEPQIHLAIFSIKMNLIKLIILFSLGLGANKEKGRFYAFLISAEEPQNWLRHKTSLEENG